jgi:photosystem II stability/assembly factor-like uncharacterized protein
MLCSPAKGSAVAKRLRRPLLISLALATVSALALPITPATAEVASFTVVDSANPATSFNNTLAGAGGRVNGLAVAWDQSSYYAATEFGGIYKSTDGGRSWRWLLTHRPSVTWDVEVDPSNVNRVYATSFFDGRIKSRTLSGIQVSTNAGGTWGRPDSAIGPPSSVPCAQARRDEPSAYGIAVNRGTPSTVFIGTNCGVAITQDAGVTWRFTNPSGDGNRSIVQEVVNSSGVVDICGEAGHYRSFTSGSLWTKPSSAAGGAALPNSNVAGGQMCSIAASPDESNVLFAFVNGNIYETVDGGFRWRALDNVTPSNPSPQGRIPFLTTNDTTAGFDLWVGDVSLHRRACATRPATLSRCPAAAGASDRVDNDNDGAIDAADPDEGWFGATASGFGGGFTRIAGAHDDAGDLVFSPLVIRDACPMLFSSDGGIYQQTATSCQSPRWREAARPPQAWWVWDLAGHDQPGEAEDLYVALQDNGMWGNNSAGASTPANVWNAPGTCCDAFDVGTDGSSVLYTFAGNAAINSCAHDALTRCGPIGTGNYPPGGIPYEPGSSAHSIIGLPTEGSYLMATSQGLFVTTDVSTPPDPTVNWSAVGTSPPPNGFCGVHVSQAGTFNMRMFAENGCSKDLGVTIWQNSAFGGPWRQVQGPPTGGLFSLFEVHPNDSRFMYAAWLEGLSQATATARMIFSRDGGATWSRDDNLTAALEGDPLRTGTSEFKKRSKLSRGPWPYTGTWVQPSLLAFDPADRNVILAGGEDSGLVISTNGGTDWVPLVNQIFPFILPRPVAAYFDDEPNAAPTIFVGSRGMGVWRFGLIRTRLSLDQIHQPYVETGGYTHIVRTVRNSLRQPGEVTVFQQIPDNVVFDPARSSPGCVLGTDRAVRCRIGFMNTSSSSVDIAVYARDNGNQQADCTQALATARVYSNAIDTTPGNDTDSNSWTVCV